MNTTSKMFKSLLGGGLSLLLIFTLVGQAVAQTCFAPPAGLVAWWPGDGNANDIVGGNDGVLNGDTSFTSGKVGQAFSFDGLGDFVQLPGTFGGGPELTIDAWIKTTGTTTDFQIIVSANVPGEFAHLQTARGNGTGNIAVYTDTFLPLGMLSGWRWRKHGPPHEWSQQECRRIQPSFRAGTF